MKQLKGEEKLLNLIKNEVYKIIRSKKMYIFGSILLGITLIICIGIKYSGQLETPITGDMIPGMMLQGIIDMLMPIFIIVLIAGMITDEYKNGTLKLFLLHPLSRGKLLGAKAITVVVMTVILLIYTMIISYIAGIGFFGMGDSVILDGILTTIKGYMISILPLIAFGMLTFIIALKLPSSGATVGVSIGVLFTFTIASQVLEKLRPYMITTYFKMFMQEMESKDLLMSLGVVFAYGIGSYIISHIIFSRKDILE